MNEKEFDGKVQEAVKMLNDNFPMVKFIVIAAHDSVEDNRLGGRTTTVAYSSRTRNVSEFEVAGIVRHVRESEDWWKFIV